MAFCGSFCNLEGGHNSPPHVFFRHVKRNAARSDTHRIRPIGIRYESRKLEMRRLQVDFIIFRAWGWTCIQTHSHLFYLQNESSFLKFPTAREAKRTWRTHTCYQIWNNWKTYVLYNRKNTWKENMILYTSSFEYSITARIASKTKNIKLLEEKSRGGSTHVLL